MLFSCQFYILEFKITFIYHLYFFVFLLNLEHPIQIYEQPNIINTVFLSPTPTIKKQMAANNQIFAIVLLFIQFLLKSQSIYNIQKILFPIVFSTILFLKQVSNIAPKNPKIKPPLISLRFNTILK